MGATLELRPAQDGNEVAVAISCPQLASVSNQSPASRAGHVIDVLRPVGVSIKPCWAQLHRCELLTRRSSARARSALGPYGSPHDQPRNNGKLDNDAPLA
jgi:hypothetical protein